ncbi:MAG: YdcF family protein [Polyangiaceae bacterium]
MPGPPGQDDAIVVLGCRVAFDREGRLTGALGRRVRAAAGRYAEHAGVGTFVVASGGRRWEGEVEADAIAGELVALGVPDARIVRERCSLSTRENARFVAAALGRRGTERATVVTCSWHVERAVALFRSFGVDARGFGAAPAPAPLARAMWRWGRERVLTWVQRR